MKKYSIIPMVLLIGAMALSSCVKNELENHFNYVEVGKELKIPLTKATIIDFGVNTHVSSVVHVMNTDFMDEGVLFDPINNVFSGVGNRVNIKFIVPEDRIITTGTYNYVSIDSIPFSNVSDSIPFSFSSGFIDENYDYANLTGHHHIITGGTLIVITDGLNYDFTFNCTLSTGNTFVGTYKGSMSYYDLSNLKK